MEYANVLVILSGIGLALIVSTGIGAYLYIKDKRKE